MKELENHMTQPIEVKCPECNGEGLVLVLGEEDVCPECEGRGLVWR